MDSIDMEELPKKENPTLEFLQKTKSQIADLTKRVAQVTKSGIESTTGAIQSKVVESKERSKKKKEAKMESLKNDIRDDGFIDIAPPMMVLPDVDAEQLELMNSQNEAQIQIVEEMVRLSERIDLIERRLTSLGTAVTKNPIGATIEHSIVEEKPEKRIVRSGNVLVEVLNIMGASLLLLVSLFAVDGYIRDNELMLMNQYQLSIPLWTLGVFTWSLFLFFRMAQVGTVLTVPILYRIQISLAIAMAAMMGMLLSEESLSTISSAWVWTTVLASAAIIGVSMITSAWRMTKKMVGIKETNEVID
ncbi:MAG: hypothetical protein CMA18_007970 [Methanobacteriota archaeon]|nr:MAG: hypothetical protein CBC63_00755 [Euryarchaeota archaeon TMED103]RAH08787.1 MAG: hypothetical protein CMA18_007970 [Euryarchaeota archaeon]